MLAGILIKFSFALSVFTITVIFWAVTHLCYHIAAKRKMDESAETSEFMDNVAIESAFVKLRAAFALTWVTPLVLCGGYIVAGMLDTVYMGWEALVMFYAGGVVLWCLAIIRWRLAMRRYEEIRWHISALKMVDEAVAPLIQRGHIIFRDFITDGLSVDHLIVGPKGVFALQTLVRPVLGKPGQLQDTMVTYDGRTLFFPNEKEQLSVEQATRCAEEISDWLSERLDNPVAARAIVALPGWQIKRISAEGISVINPNQMEALFQYIKPRPLAGPVIQQIVRQVEQHIAQSRSAQFPTSSDQEMTCWS